MPKQDAGHAGQSHVQGVQEPVTRQPVTGRGGQGGGGWPPGGRRCPCVGLVVVTAVSLLINACRTPKGQVSRICFKNSFNRVKKKERQTTQLKTGKGPEQIRLQRVTGVTGSWKDAQHHQSPRKCRPEAGEAASHPQDSRDQDSRRTRVGEGWTRGSPEQGWWAWGAACSDCGLTRGVPAAPGGTTRAAAAPETKTCPLTCVFLSA